MKRGDLLSLTVESLAFGGDRIARAADGRVVFVDGGAPGDRVDARLDSVKSRFARARVETVRTHGPAHVEAPCAVVEKCGGCPWQSVSLSAQRDAKYSIVERALHRVAPHAEIRPLVAATDGFGYRSRARFSVKEGAIGYSGRRSHDIVDVETCPILDPALDRALRSVRQVLGRSDEKSAAAHRTPPSQIAALVGRSGTVQLAVVGTVDDATRERLRALASSAGPIVSVLFDDVAQAPQSIDVSDSNEPPFHAVADGFAQASHQGNRTLRAIVFAAVGGPHERILELYAGDGNFTRDLARACTGLVAIEGVHAAAARIRSNVAALCSTPVTVVAQPVETAARRLAAIAAQKPEMGFDVVLLDPPRAGAAGLAPTLAALTPRIVYVSCDPMTLARDAAALGEHGYSLVHATPIDLMPHSFHVETVALFER